MKALDVFFVVSFLFVFGVVLEYIAVLYQVRKKAERMELEEKSPEQEEAEPLKVCSAGHRGNTHLTSLPLVSGNTHLTSLPLVSGNTHFTSLQLVSESRDKMSPRVQAPFP